MHVPLSLFLTTEHTEHTETNPPTFMSCFHVFRVFRVFLAIGYGFPGTAWSYRAGLLLGLLAIPP